MDATQSRKNRIKCLSKAVCHYAEGPADIDPLLDQALNQLGEVVILMKGAQARAAEEEGHRREVDDLVHNRNGDTDAFLMRKEIRELAISDPGVMMELIEELQHRQAVDASEV